MQRPCHARQGLLLFEFHFRCWFKATDNRNPVADPICDRSDPAHVEAFAMDGLFRLADAKAGTVS